MSTPVSTAPSRIDPETSQDRRSVLPASLAALAEASFLYLPVHVLAVDAANVTQGPFANPWLFSVIVAGSTALLTRVRRFKVSLTVAAMAAAGIGVLQANTWGDTDLTGTVATVVISLLVALRIVVLSLRDWRNPMKESFAVGSFALLLEAAFVGTRPELQGMMPPLVLQFFLAALGSRAASLRLARPLPAEPSSEEAAATGRRWSRAAVIVLGGLGGLLALAVVLGGEQGGIAALGHVVLGAVGAVVGFVVLLIARLVLGPLNAVLTRLNLDLTAFQRLADTLNQFGQGAQDAGGAAGGSILERLLGLAVLVAIVALLVRAMRRHFALLDRRGADLTDVPEIEASPLGPSTGRFRRRSRARRELPADTIRRWYAEALLMLERRGLGRPATSTPAEFLLDVRAAYPECGAEFAVLTRAYEDVRYGSRTFERSALDQLEAHRLQLMGALHRAKKLEPSKEGGAP